MEKQTRLGRIISIHRAIAGLSNKEVARRLGVDPTHASRIAKGVRGVSPDKVDKTADVLGVSPEVRREMHAAAARDQGYKF